MKGLLFFGAFALLAFVSCKDIDVPYVPEDTPDGTYDEAWYADNATVSSTDPYFDYTEEGSGTISFKAEGGSVVVYVDCGTEWAADDSGAGVFGCELQSTSITVTADQNLVEEELYGTITLMTAESKILFATISITQNAYGAPEITVEANEWHVPAVAATAEELTTEIGVEATDEWEVECDSEWLTAEKGENSVSLTAAENETLEERVAEVVLTCTDGYNSDSETITVTQDARAYITLSTEEFEFDKMGGDVEVTVESNFEWEYTFESDWFSVTENTDGSLTITAGINATGADREGTVVFTASDGAANTAETTLSITQGIEDPDALILEYTITSGNTTIQLPITDVTNAKIDWGDGSDVETATSDWPSHTYSDEGTYTVSISGTVNTISSSSGYRDQYGGFVAISGAGCLTAVIQWGNLGLTSMEYAFFDCTNFTSLPEGPGPFENVTTFHAAFLNCTSLTTVPEDMFSGCSSAENFQNVFEGCSNLTSAPSFTGLSNAKDFSYAFYYCTSLTTVPENMFSGCTAAKDFSYAFYYCTSLTTIPENLFVGCPSVGSFYEVFYRCTSLESVPVGIFDNNKLVTDFSYAFYNCSKLVGESPYTEIEGNNVHLYERENYPDYFTAPTSYSSCFRNCTKLDDYADIPSGWK